MGAAVVPEQSRGRSGLTRVGANAVLFFLLHLLRDQQRCSQCAH